MTDQERPPPHSKVKCVINTDREDELTLGQIYTVVSDPYLDKMPMNDKRFQPDDFRLIAIMMPGKKEPGFYPLGLFEKIDPK